MAKVEALQSKQLAHATRMEILTQHDGAEFMRESDSNRECVGVIDKLLIRVPNRGPVFNEKLCARRGWRRARQVLRKSGKERYNGSSDTSARKIRKIETRVPQAVTSPVHRNRDPISRIAKRLVLRGFLDADIASCTHRRTREYVILYGEGFCTVMEISSLSCSAGAAGSFKLRC